MENGSTLALIHLDNKGFKTLLLSLGKALCLSFYSPNVNLGKQYILRWVNGYNTNGLADRGGLNKSKVVINRNGL